ncbi:MAG: peptide chain release factor N(5)-glutamine methyltransferase [bacterium]|nr:peptide chain release factor N(5)-glutamine methyltransferase [bacterium]
MVEPIETIASLHEWGCTVLGTEQSYDVRLLLSSALNQPLSYLIGHPDERVSNAQFVQYKSMIKRRQLHEPVAYILGEVGFGPRMYRVAADVLVPRPETELLVEAALGMVSDGVDVSVLECGIGSGVVACEIGLNRAKAQLSGWDINPTAVSLSKDNASLHGVTNVSVYQGDFFSGVRSGGYFPSDLPILLVSNPPYIPSSDIEGLDATVRDYESRVALDGGETGYDFYVELAKLMRDILDSGTRVSMCCEFGMGQENGIRDICARYNLGPIGFDRDYSGIYRVMRVGIM